MKIKAVSEQYDIPADTLRYWERVGAIPAVHRDSAGYRDYDEEDLGWVSFAKCMRGAGVSIEYLIEYITLYPGGERTHQARKDLLTEQLEVIKRHLDEVQETYDRISDKVAHYDDHVEGATKKLTR